MRFNFAPTRRDEEFSEEVTPVKISGIAGPRYNGTAPAKAVEQKENGKQINEDLEHSCAKRKSRVSYKESAELDDANDKEYEPSKKERFSAGGN